MSVYMPKINYILLIYRNLFLSPTYTSKLLLLNSLIEFLGAKTDIHLKEFSVSCFSVFFKFILVSAFRIFLLRCASGAACEAHQIVGWSVGCYFHSLAFLMILQS